MQLQTSVDSFKHFMAVGFSTIFFALAFALTMTTANTIAQGFAGELPLTEAFLKAINVAVVALAIMELGFVVNMEYARCHDEHSIDVVLTRTLPRFVSIACIALVLEGLLMVIKYSQLDRAGNLYYPVAVIISASCLLASLGVFIQFCNRGLGVRKKEALPLVDPAERPANETVICRP